MASVTRVLLCDLFSKLPDNHLIGKNPCVVSFRFLQSFQSCRKPYLPERGGFTQAMHARDTAIRKTHNAPFSLACQWIGVDAPQVAAHAGIARVAQKFG